MARPKKDTIDYFPHIINHGKTMFILESKFGNNGYAFWFKLLELLGSSEGMVYNYNNPVNWEFLLAKTKVDGETAESILETLASVDAIDGDLLKEKMLWSDNFVKSFEGLFKKRTQGIPKKPALKIKPEVNIIPVSATETIVSGAETPVSAVETPQSKVEYSKVNKKKEKESKEKEKSPAENPLSKNPKSKFYVATADELKSYFQATVKKTHLKQPEEFMIARILDKGIPFFIIKQAVEGIMARDNCPKASEGDRPGPGKSIFTITYFQSAIFQEHEECTHKLEPELELLPESNRIQKNKFDQLIKEFLDGKHIKAATPKH